MKFLSKTLPILKADDTLPKVTQIVDKNFNENDLGDGSLSKRTFDDDDDDVNDVNGGHDLTDEDKEEQQNHHNVDELEHAEETKSREKRSAEHKRVKRSKKFCDGGIYF